MIQVNLKKNLNNFTYWEIIDELYEIIDGNSVWTTHSSGYFLCKQKTFVSTTAIGMVAPVGDRDSDHNRGNDAYDGVSTDGQYSGHYTVPNIRSHSGICALFSPCIVVDGWSMTTDLMDSEYQVDRGSTDSVPRDVIWSLALFWYQNHLSDIRRVLTD